MKPVQLIVNSPTTSLLLFTRFLTNEGIEYLREYLNLPNDVVPATLKKSARPAGEGRRPPMGGDRPPRGPREGGYRWVFSHQALYSLFDPCVSCMLLCVSSFLKVMLPTKRQWRLEGQKGKPDPAVFVLYCKAPVF